MKNYVRKFISPRGFIYYYDENDEYHRIDGPAVERDNEERRWYIHGKLHRIAGPAIELSVGAGRWIVNDCWLYQAAIVKLQEFRKLFNDDEFLSFLFLEGKITL